MATESIVERRILHEGRRSLVALAVARAGSAEILRREVLECPDAAAVIPYDPGRRSVVLVSQMRAPVLAAGGPPAILEAVAGLIDGDESPEACIRREAMEEAGLRLAELEKVGTVWSSPGFATERMHLFLAPVSQASRIGEGGGLAAEGERIRRHEIALPDLARMLAENAFADLKTLALAQALLLRHAELFR